MVGLRVIPNPKHPGLIRMLPLYASKRAALRDGRKFKNLRYVEFEAGVEGKKQ